LLLSFLMFFFFSSFTPVKCKVQFHKPETFVGEDAVVSLVVAVNCPLPIRFTSIRVFFLPREVSHVFFDRATSPIPEKAKDSGTSPIDFVDCGGSAWSDTVFQKDLDLVFYPKRLRVFEIPLRAKKVREVKCSLVTFHLDLGGRHLALHHKIMDISPLEAVEHRHANVGVIRKSSGKRACLSSQAPLARCSPFLFFFFVFLGSPVQKM